MAAFPNSGFDPKNDVFGVFAFDESEMEKLNGAAAVVAAVSPKTLVDCTGVIVVAPPKIEPDIAPPD